MKTRNKLIVATLALIFVGTLCAGLLKWRGFRATSTPSTLETVAARSVRDFAIPAGERHKANPDAGDSSSIQQGREDFLIRCASCHGVDARGRTPIGANVYPRVPDLHSDATQNLTDGEIHYIIENGIQLTGMPAMASYNGDPAVESWKLVSYIRSLRPLNSGEKTIEASTSTSAHYVGSQTCQKCHPDIYDRWKKTPMANVVREPRDRPRPSSSAGVRTGRTRSRTCYQRPRLLRERTHFHLHCASDDREIPDPERAPASCLAWKCRAFRFSRRGTQKILALGLCATCYTLKRQDKEDFGGLREAVLERDGYCCRVCGASGRRKRSIVVHHRVPGKSLLHLMISLCPRCHAKVGRTKCVLSEMPSLLLLLWREQHPDGHEQVMIDFTMREMPAETVGLFPEEIQA